MVKAILSTTTEGRQVLSDMKKIDAEREAAKEKDQPEEMDRTNKVELFVRWSYKQVISPTEPTEMDLLGSRDNMINGFNGQFFQVGDVALYGSIFVFEGLAFWSINLLTTPDAYFLWRAKSIKDVTIESLSILTAYNPAPSKLFVLLF